VTRGGFIRGVYEYKNRLQKPHGPSDDGSSRSDWIPHTGLDRRGTGRDLFVQHALREVRSGAVETVDPNAVSFSVNDVCQSTWLWRLVAKHGPQHRGEKANQSKCGFVLCQ
jgi:hypothetical protein